MITFNFRSSLRKTTKLRRAFNSKKKKKITISFHKIFAPDLQYISISLLLFTFMLNLLIFIVSFKVKFETSTYKSILPGDVGAIFGFRPNYHETPTIENFINYFPFNNNITGDGAPIGTTGYFSIAAGSFIQEVTTEKRYIKIYVKNSQFIWLYGYIDTIINI